MKRKSNSKKILSVILSATMAFTSCAPSLIVVASETETTYDYEEISIEEEVLESGETEPDVESDILDEDILITEESEESNDEQILLDNELDVDEEFEIMILNEEETESQDEPQFLWNGSECQAVFTDDYGNITEVACTVEETIIIPVSCEAEGYVDLVATVEKDGKTYSDTQENVMIPALGHSYSEYEEIYVDLQGQQVSILQAECENGCGSVLKRVPFIQGELTDTISWMIVTKDVDLDAFFEAVEQQGAAGLDQYMDNMKLLITGTGAMPDFEDENHSGYDDWIHSGLVNALSSVEISEGITSIGVGAFYGLPIESVSIPSTVNSIGSGAFADCMNLTQINISGNGLQEISYGAFCIYSGEIPSSWNGFDITLPDSITSIGEVAFANSAAKKYIIGSDIEYIGSGAFGYMGDEVENPDDYKEIYFTGNAPAFESDAFYGQYAYVYYTDDETWDSVAGLSYGGRDIIWEEYNPRHTHVWGNPIFNWDGDTCNVTITCTDCDNSKSIEATVTSNVTIEPTCTEPGVATVCATVDKNDQTFVDTKEMTIPALGHMFMNYVVDDNGETKTAYCENECGETDTISIDQYTDSGIIDGTDLYWKVVSTGEELTLYIIGNGILPDVYQETALLSDDESGSLPWNQYQEYITRVELSSGIEAIGTGVFQNYHRLKEIVIPDNSKLTSIGKYAFYGTSLERIDLNRKLSYIGEYAFSDINSNGHDYGNDFLSSYMRNGVNVVFNGARPMMENTSFSNSNVYYFYPYHGQGWGNEKPLFTEYHAYAYDIENEEVLSGYGKFGTNVSWKTILHEDGNSTLKISGSGEMDKLIGYTSYYENGLGDLAFDVVDVEFEGSITSIGAYAFASCVNVEEFILPSTITYIDTNAFNIRVFEQNLLSLDDVLEDEDRQYEQSIIFTGDAPEIYEDAFKHANFNIYYPRDKAGWDEPGVRSEYNAWSVEWIPYISDDHIHSITDVQFVWNEEGEFCKIYVSCDSCGEIDSYECQVSKNIISEATCTEDGYADATASFEYNSVVYTDSKNNCRQNAYGHKFIEYIEDPCGYTKTAVCENGCGESESIFSNDATAYGRLTDTIDWHISRNTLYITGNGDMPDFEEERPWENLIESHNVYRIIVGEGIRKIGNNSFCNFSNPVAEVILPDTLERIGKDAFSCSDIISLVIPASVTDIGAMAFYSTYFDSISFAENSQLTSIGNSAFADASFSYLELPPHVQVIKDGAFRGSGRVEITGNELKKIGANAFEDNQYTVSLKIPDSVEIIGDSAFMGSNIQNISLGEDSKLIRFPGFSFAYSNEPVGVIMLGDAPTFKESSFESCYQGVTVFYNPEKEGWNEVITQSFGPYVTFTPINQIEEFILPTLEDISAMAGEEVKFSIPLMQDHEQDVQIRWVYRCSGEEKWKPIDYSFIELGFKYNDYQEDGYFHLGFEVQKNCENLEFAAVYNTIYGDVMTNPAKVNIVPGGIYIPDEYIGVVSLVGENATLEANAEGENIEYCWYEFSNETGEYTEIDGENERTLTIIPEASGDYSYLCVLSNDNVTVGRCDYHIYVLNEIKTQQEVYYGNIQDIVSIEWTLLNEDATTLVQISYDNGNTWSNVADDETNIVINECYYRDDQYWLVVDKEFEEADNGALLRCVQRYMVDIGEERIEVSDPVKLKFYEPVEITEQSSYIAVSEDHDAKFYVKGTGSVAWIEWYLIPEDSEELILISATEEEFPMDKFEAEVVVPGDMVENGTVVAYLYGMLCTDIENQEYSDVVSEDMQLDVLYGFDWTVGSIDRISGKNKARRDTIRTGFYSVEECDLYIQIADSRFAYEVFAYDEFKRYIGTSGKLRSNTVALPEGTEYIRFIEYTAEYDASFKPSESMNDIDNLILNRSEINEDTKVFAEQVILNYPERFIKPDEEIQLAATVYPVEAVNKEITWTSSNPEVATVDANGKVTGISVGDTIISASTTNGIVAESAINVDIIVEFDWKAGTIDSVSGKNSYRKDTVRTGYYRVQDCNLIIQALGTNIRYAIYGYDEFKRYVGWTKYSKNSEYSLPERTKYIRFTLTNEKYDSSFYAMDYLEELKLIIQNRGEIEEDTTVFANSIKLNYVESIIVPGEELQLGATVYPEAAANKDIIWSSSDESIATVDATGKVTGISVGDVIITAKTTNDIITEANIIVDRVCNLEWSVGSISTVTGKNTVRRDTIRTAYYSRDNINFIIEMAGKNATYCIFEYDEYKRYIGNTGYLKNKNYSLSEDTCYVRIVVTTASYIQNYMAAEHWDELTGIVRNRGDILVDTKEFVEEVLLSNSKRILAPGETFQISAICKPLSAINNQLTWESSNSEVAEVDETGLVVAKNYGTALISAKTNSGIVSECLIRVGMIEPIEWSIGTINLTTGQNNTRRDTIRSGYYKVEDCELAVQIEGSNLCYAILGYDENKNYIGTTGYMKKNSYSIPDGAVYVRFVVVYASYDASRVYDEAAYEKLKSVIYVVK